MLYTYHQERKKVIVRSFCCLERKTKTLKKLKVILPVILTLAVSTSAAVTGTVAWFTATRLRTVAMEGITVVNPEAGLDVTSVTNVANTKVDGVNSNFTIKHLKTTDGSKNLLIRDAPVNASDDAVFRAVLNDETEAQTIILLTELYFQTNQFFMSYLFINLTEIS